MSVLQGFKHTISELPLKHHYNNKNAAKVQDNAYKKLILIGYLSENLTFPIRIFYNALF